MSTTMTNEPDTRQLVLDAIGTQELTVAEIAEATGRGETTVREAVKALVDDGTLVARKNGRALSYARPVEASPPDDGHDGRSRTNRVAVAQERDRRVLEAIRQAGDDGARVGDLAASLELDRGLTYLSVWRMHKAGVVRKVATGSRSPSWVAVS